MRKTLFALIILASLAQVTVGANPDKFWGIYHRMTRIQLEACGYKLALVPESDKPPMEGMSKERWEELKLLSGVRRYKVTGYPKDRDFPSPGSLEISLRINQSRGADHVVSITALYKPKEYKKLKTALANRYGLKGSESKYAGMRSFIVRPPGVVKNGTPEPGAISLMRMEENEGRCVLGIQFQNPYYR